MSKLPYEVYANLKKCPTEAFLLARFALKSSRKTFMHGLGDYMYVNWEYTNENGEALTKD